jgi:hypothetical protein
MQARLIVRLLDEAGALLGWAPLRVEARGDAMLRASHGLALTVEQAGLAYALSFHWADVHIQRRVLVGPLAVSVGQQVPVVGAGEVVWILPSDTGPLPAVSVRGASIAVPTGAMTGA